MESRAIQLRRLPNDEPITLPIAADCQEHVVEVKVRHVRTTSRRKDRRVNHRRRHFFLGVDELRRQQSQADQPPPPPRTMDRMI